MAQKYIYFCSYFEYDFILKLSIFVYDIKFFTKSKVLIIKLQKYFLTY